MTRFLCSDFILFDEEFRLIKDVISRLKADAQAKVVFIVDKNGQTNRGRRGHGEPRHDLLASLTAGNGGGDGRLARLIGERGVPVLFHEGERDNVYISVVAQRVILVVIFDERSSLGLVRLRVRKANAELERIFDTIQQKLEPRRPAAWRASDSPFAEITGRRTSTTSQD